MGFNRNNKLTELTTNLRSGAVSFGMSDEGKLIVEEYIEHYEFGLAFEHIVYELCENNISINSEYYNEIKNVGGVLKINESDYRPRLENLISPLEK